MSDEMVTASAEMPVNDEPRADVAAEVPAEAEKPSVEDDLSSVWDKMNAAERARDERGRFASTQEKAIDGEEAGPATDEQVAPVEGDEAKPAEVQQYASPDEALKAKWDTLDTDAKTVISEQRQWLDRAQAQMQAFVPLGQVLGTHADYLQQVAGQNVPAYINNLLTYSRQLDTNPAETIRQLADMYNVDLAAISNPFAEGYVDPATAALKQELALLKQQVAGVDQQRQFYEQQRAQQESAQLLSITESFFAAHPDAEQVADEIELQVRAIKQRNPAVDPKTALQQAYDRAVWTNDSTRQARLKADAEKAEKARADAAKKAAEQAKRAKSINVNGSIANRKPTSVEETMSSVWDRLHS